MLDPKLIPLLLPILIIQLVVQIIALVDLYKREQVTWGKKWVWVLIIILGELLGPAVYFILGRKEA